MLKPALFSLCILALGVTAQFAAPFAADADDIVMPTAGAPATVPVSLPTKGQTMAQVAKRYGEPQQKHPPAGGDAPRHPPITRWDYAGFSVFFEHAHVVDAVVPGHPPEVYHAEQLQAASH